MRTLPVKERAVAMQDAESLIERYLSEHNASTIFPYSNKNDNKLPVNEIMSKPGSIVVSL